MGYYSTLAIQENPYTHDHSVTPPEMQLLWRLEELQDRMEELVAKRRIVEDRVTFCEDNLRYVLPKHFVTAADVKAAMDLAIYDLQERYGIKVRQETEEEPVVDEITGMQISFFDILTGLLRYQPQAA